MTARQVLFVGGSGVVGREAVGWFRRRYPDVPILIGGRNLEKANELAKQTGLAEAIAVDLDKPKLGLSDDVAVSAVAMFAPDDGLWGLGYAQDQGAAYINIGNGLVEVGPEVAHFAHKATAAPIVLASQWSAGAAMFLALHAAGELDQVQAINIGVLLDEKDPAGPLSYEDMERTHEMAASTLVFENGRRTWISGDAAKGIVHTIDGRRLDADAYAPFDIINLHAATQAPNIRFDLVTDTSSSRRRGEEAAAEIVADAEGTRDGQPTQVRATLEFKYGQASLTGLSVALSLGAVLGLDDAAPAAPGLYFPELLYQPDRFVDALRQVGAVIEREQPKTS